MKSNFLCAAIFCHLSLHAQAGKLTQVIHDFYAAVDMGDFDKASVFLNADVKVNIPFSPVTMDKMAYKQLGMSMKAGFPDMQHKILETTEGKNSVAFKAWFSGTNKGSLMGNPPTGNRVETPFLGYMIFNDKGEITEVNLQFDTGAFNAQLMKGIDPAAAAEAIIRNMLAAADAGDANKFMSFWANNGENYFLGNQTSQAEMRERIVSFKAAFPDIRRPLDEVVVSGNTVMVRGWVTGTNKGQFMGHEATGNAIKVSWLGIYHLNAAGKVESGSVELDTETLKNQVSGSLKVTK